jgi:hypothetical protein
MHRPATPCTPPPLRFIGLYKRNGQRAIVSKTGDIVVSFGSGGLLRPLNFSTA